MKNLHYQIAAWSAFAAIVFVTLSPIQMRPGDLLSVDVDRALAFGFLASAFMIAYPRHAMTVGLLVLAAALATEALQLLSPTRHARVDDALIKAAGGAAGMATAFVYNGLRVARHARRARVVAMEHMAETASGETGMTALPVRSALIAAAYFSPEDGKLRIRLQDGQERLFQGVGLEDAQALVRAPSPDVHYAEVIQTKFRRLAA
jgi:hypothetical protein